MFREIKQTENSTYAHTIQLTDAVVDNRALTYRAAVFGKAQTSSETIAETVVKLDQVVAVGETLMNPMYLHRALEVLFPKEDAKLTEGQGMFVFGMLIDAFRFSFSKVGNDTMRSADNQSVTALAHVFADITSQSLSKRNLMLPTEGHISLLTATNIFPTADVVKEAIQVKQLADVIDTLHLDPQIGRVKTTTVAALRTAMGPAMSAAGRRILQLATMNDTFDDSMTLLNMFLRRSEDMPKRIDADINLQALASNMTMVRIALDPINGYENRTLYNPDYSFAQILAEVARLIRDNPRFSIRSLREVREYYSHIAVKDTNHRVTGLVVGRNVAFNYKAQATIFTMVGSPQSPLWSQTPVPGVEAVVDGFVSPMNGLSTASTMQTVANIASLTGRSGVALTYGMTEEELLYYAAATSQETVLAIDELGISSSFMFVNVDHGEAICYDTKSVYFGDEILSEDPAEAIIHAAEKEFFGNKHYEAKSQLIPVDFRKATFFTNPEEYATSLADTVTANIVLADGTLLSTEVETARLLRLTKKTDVKLTISPMNAAFLDGYVSTLLDMVNSMDISVPEAVRSAALMQTAMALNSVLARVYGSASAKAFARSIQRYFMASAVGLKLDASQVRGDLNRGLTIVQLQLIAATLMLRLFGLLNVNSQELMNLMEESKLSQYLIGTKAVDMTLD